MLVYYTTLLGLRKRTRPFVGARVNPIIYLNAQNIDVSVRSHRAANDFHTRRHGRGGDEEVHDHDATGWIGSTTPQPATPHGTDPPTPGQVKITAPPPRSITAVRFRSFFAEDRRNLFPPRTLPASQPQHLPPGPPGPHGSRRPRTPPPLPQKAPHTGWAGERVT